MTLGVSSGMTSQSEKTLHLGNTVQILSHTCNPPLSDNSPNLVTYLNMIMPSEILVYGHAKILDQFTNVSLIELRYGIFEKDLLKNDVSVFFLYSLTSKTHFT